MGSPVISISNGDGELCSTQIEMNKKSEPVEIALYSGEKEIDPADFKIFLRIDHSKKRIPLRSEGGIAKIYASDIDLAAGVYAYTLFMDGKSIMAGYLLWGDNAD